MEPYLMYILLLGAVIFVGAMIIPRKQHPTGIKHDQTVQNMENALEQFMENMEKDNEELVALIAKAQHTSKVDSESKEQRIAELERKYRELEQRLEHSQQQASLEKPASSSPLLEQLVQTQFEMPAPAPQPAPSESIQSRYGDLFALYDQGKSIEMISKKLGMNKGEVQLVLQLAKQEAAANG